MLVVHRSTSGTVLARALADLLNDPLADPFASELVAVPAKGVERWLAQRLSHVLGAENGDGVCANVTFPSPGRMLDEALRAVSPEHRDAAELWTPGQARWPLLEVIDACIGEPWCASLARYLGDEDGDKGRRVAVATRLARLYDEYGQSRPEMLRAWARGRYEQGDGIGLDPDLTWEAELWTRLRDRLGRPAPAELLPEATRRLVADPELCDLPPRLSVFGATRLSPARLTVLAALATHRDVHLWVNHPSPTLWDTVAGTAPFRLRSDDTVRSTLRNPLLASMSRDVLEMQQLLTRFAPDATTVRHDASAYPDTLLGQLKRGLANDAVTDDPPLLAPDDDSVQVHSCHGRTRQVEVLREVVLGLLAADPTLEPRDVLVMCPDIETFAPLIAATFSLGSESDDAVHPAARLRVRLADRSLRQTNSLMALLADVLELGTARITASQILDLAGSPAVRARFGFDDDELERLRDWVTSANIRWGLDREHRGAWQLRDVPQGTWRDGLDRLLLGAAMEGGLQLVHGVVPLDDVDSSDIDLAGRLAELVERVAAVEDLMAERRTAAEWMSGLEEAVLGLGAAPRDATWQQVQLSTELADLAEAAEANASPIGLADVRSILDHALAGRPTRSSFRTGTLTVCTLVPMRSVPHRVVCLIGLDDGSFPRQGIQDGDDILVRSPWVGERDPRSEDRQLFLDAVGAAEEHLVITYSGADERTGAEIPPAVPLGELLDALDRTARTTDGRRVRDVVTVRQPLQPFDRRNFVAGALTRDRPFSFDPLGYAGAAAADAPRQPDRPFLPEPLPPKEHTDIDLADLHRLLAHPAKGFLRQRLGVATSFSDDDPSDVVPVGLDALEAWGVGERALRERAAGLDAAACRDIEIRRGALPPGALGADALRKIGKNVDLLYDATTEERAVPPEAFDVDVDLGDGTRLTGTVAGVRGDTLLSMTYSSLAAKHRLRSWVDLVALTATDPSRPWCAVTVGRGRGGAARSEVGPLTAEDARAALLELVGLYRSGLDGPLPMAVKTSHAYAEQRQFGSPVPDARENAARRWLPDDRFPGENGDPEHELLYGATAALAVLTDPRPQPYEQGTGWSTEETDRFGRLSRRLWERYLRAERTVHR